MNIFNNNIIKKIINYSLKKGYVEWLPHIYKYFSKNWVDNQGNNFYHFAAMHHNEDLFKIAVQNEANINQMDNRGNAPIHRFIESCFIIEKDDIVFNYNENVLNLFIEGNVNINQWIDYDKRNLKEEEKAFLFSRNNILGSPMELLISVFWDKILLPNKIIKEEYIERYQKIYTIFSKNGANINFLKDGSIFYDIENEKTIDAMQIGKSTILSHYYIQYVRNDNDLVVVKSLVSDPRIDFALKDEQENTFLHNLFARISRRYENLDRLKVQEVLFIMFNNPSFKAEYLEIENSFRLKAIGCLKKEANEYKKFFDTLILQKKLDNDLDKKELKTKAIKRVKI